MFHPIRTHRRAVKSVLLGLLVAALFLAAAAPSFLSSATAATKKLPVYCVQRDDNCVSLTFDAAWGNEDTQTLIDILGRYGVHATFFVVGAWAEKYPESVKALHDAGHEVMTHSDDHAHFAKLNRQQIMDNLNAGCDKIEAVTGVRPTLFRCPYGEYNDLVIQTAEDMGIRTIQWSVEPVATASTRWGARVCGDLKTRREASFGPAPCFLLMSAKLLDQQNPQAGELPQLSVICDKQIATGLYRGRKLKGIHWLESRIFRAYPCRIIRIDPVDVNHLDFHIGKEAAEIQKKLPVPGFVWLNRVLFNRDSRGNQFFEVRITMGKELRRGLT